MKKGKEKKQPKQPLTANKAFKAVLPVLVCIVLFIVIGITLVIISNNKGNNPKVTSPNDTYLEFGNYRITKEEMYETLRKDYGLTEVIRQIDELIFKNEISQVDTSSEKYLDFLNDKFFSESETDDDKKETWNDLLDSAVISSTITKDDADKAKDKFDDTTTSAWTKLANSYKLEYAREQWAINQFLANYRSEKGLETTDDVISEDDIKEEFNSTYGEDAANGGKNAIAIVIPFTSEEAAKKLMAYHGINTEVLGTYTDGWIKSTFDEKGTEKPKETDYFSEDEVMKIFCDMYNEVLGYYTGADIITSENYTLEYDAVKTLAKMKKVLNVKMESYATVKQNIDLPTTIEVSDLDKHATIKWVQKIKDGEETTEIQLSNGKLEVVVPEEGSSTSINLSATIAFDDDTENTVTVSYSIVVKPEAEEITEPFETTLTVESGNNWTFSLNNEMGNGHSQFVWSYDDSTDLGKYILSTLKLGTYPGAYTIKPNELSSSSSSSSKYYYLIIKVGNQEGQTLEELHDKIKEDLTKELYSDSYSLERYYFEERAKHNIVFYDHYLERLYQFAYETCYQSLSITDFEEYKLNKKRSKTVVAKIDELQITADDLFTALETKYSPIYVASSVNRYQILKDNTLYNPWTKTIDKKYVNKAVKADVNSVKNYFTLDYFANYYGYYYFGISPYNFDSSYGWDNFIKDYYGVSEEKDLLLLSSVFGSQGRVYADSLRTYRNKVITYDVINEQMKKRNNDDKLYDVDVLNVIIYVDYNYDGTADTKKSTSNPKVTEENWNDEQVKLAYKLAEIFMTKEDLIETGEDEEEKTRYEKLEEMVEIYNEASCFKTPDENDDALTNQFAEFKKAGLFVKLEKSTFDQCDSLVEEFHDAMHKMWAVAKNSEAGLTETHNMLYDVVEDGKYAFSSPYGFHAVVVTDFRQPVEAPTADEFELYRAMSIVEANRETIESVTSSLENENVKSSKTLRESYNAELKLAQAEVEKYLQIAQKHTSDTVNEDYTMSDALKEKINKWVEEVEDVDGSTNPDIEENTSSLVITYLLNDLLTELDKGNIKTTASFNQDQLRLYINNLIESYIEEE